MTILRLLPSMFFSFFIPKAFGQFAVNVDCKLEVFGWILVGNLFAADAVRNPEVAKVDFGNQKSDIGR